MTSMRLRDLGATLTCISTGLLDLCKSTFTPFYIASHKVRNHFLRWKWNHYRRIAFPVVDHIMTEAIRHDGDDPPPYSPDLKSLTGSRDERNEDNEDDELHKTSECSGCRGNLRPELVYCCFECRKLSDKARKKQKGKKVEQQAQREKTKESKDEADMMDFAICQECKDAGTLCPYDSGDGSHVFRAYKLRDGRYLYYPSMLEPFDSEIVKSIKKGDVLELRAWANDAESVNTRDKNGHAPLHIAVMLSSGEMVKALIDMGAFIEARSDRGITPLCVALSYHCPAIVTLLLALGADVNGKDNHFAPLHRAGTFSPRTVFKL
jgi:hypothetical protein